MILTLTVGVFPQYCSFLQKSKPAVAEWSQTSKKTPQDIPIHNWKESQGRNKNQLHVVQKHGSYHCARAYPVLRLTLKVRSHLQDSHLFSRRDKVQPYVFLIKSTFNSSGIRGELSGEGSVSPAVQRTFGITFFNC